ncbi:hypothetical protein O3M35_004623 [Rhynocoris fuscipes]|uniref:Lysosomal Pro-X carboxypeptidase n=1 Tax=Rhynocoris fuscipes TaxID=488301 RepID=A0AAW1CIQ5_9HEMI
MHSFNLALIILFVNFNLCLLLTIVPKYNVNYADIKLDHFNFINNNTFKLRYLINDTFWKPNGPIFFYAGNEGDITLFAENTGYMWEIAPEFGALIVFAEHRYYGTSLPFGNKSLTEPKYSGYLSSSQALADYVDIIGIIRHKYNATSDRVKVIAFGGSYGGMLAAWMRMKYSSVITGSIAASAPIWQFTGMTSCTTYNRIVTSVFAQESPGCDKFIKKTWSLIDNIGSTDAGKSWLTNQFKTCKPLKTANDIKNLKDWLTDLYGNLAMINYPYEANFLAPLPAYPVKAVCNHFSLMNSTSKDILKKLFNGISLYFNGTGTAKCLSFIDSDKLGDESWDYQTCTEMVMPMCDNGDTMFEKKIWNIQEISDDCYKKYKVRPQENLVRDIYGGKNINWATNIIFSNGLLDPWSGGGVTYNLSESAIAVLIPGVAHHLDLRFSNPNDPDEIKQVRIYYKDIIKSWIHWTVYEHEVKII